MRNAYMLLGISLLILGSGVWFAFNRSFTAGTDTESSISGLSKQRMAHGTLLLSSSAFGENDTLPKTYTCDGDQVSPPLTFSGVPAAAQSLALIMDDPDVPKELLPGGVFDHWILFNIPADTSGIAEGASAGVSGVNSAGKTSYAPPCPPTNYEPTAHRYIFRLYALDTMLPLSEGASKGEVIAAMEGHILGEATLIAVYDRTVI